MSAKNIKISKIPKFGGSMVALVTPFKNDKIDEPKLRQLIEWHIKNGTHGIIPCGTTGESATLSHEEHERVIEITVEQTSGRVPVIAGTGSNSTKEAIQLTAHARSAGADAALLISPYYNKPSQDGLYQHYKSISEAVDIPLIIYNIPGRTVVNILPETMAKLAELNNIIGVKESTGDLKQTTAMMLLCPKNFLLLSGEDFLNYPLLSIGGHGSISVLANLIPKQMSIMMENWFKGTPDSAKQLHFKYYRLTEALFIETNPVPVKTALAMIGKIQPDIRLPLAPMSESNKRKLQIILKNYNLI